MSNRQSGYRTVLATMSYCDQVRRVLNVLGLADAFDFIASRDDVEHSKPDPEIYLLLARQLGVPPEDCLVIEDSPAGMNVVAITTPLTRQRLHESALLLPQQIVDNPSMLPGVVARVIAEHSHHHLTIDTEMIQRGPVNQDPIDVVTEDGTAQGEGR